MDKQALYKQAAKKMLQLNDENKGHRKRAHALKLLYKQAELGYGEVPHTFSELEEKLASLMNQDLEVVEKALELTGGNIKLGELDRNSNDPKAPMNADEQFQATILNQETNYL